MGAKGTSVNEAALTIAYMQLTKSRKRIEEEIQPGIKASAEAILQSNILDADEQTKEDVEQNVKIVLTATTTTTESLKGICDLFNNLISQANAINKTAAARASASADSLKAATGKLKKR